MSGDVVARAKELLNLPPCSECGGDHSSIMRIEIRDMLAELVPELVAEADEAERLRGFIKEIRATGFDGVMKNLRNNPSSMPLSAAHHALMDILDVIERAGIEP